MPRGVDDGIVIEVTGESGADLSLELFTAVERKGLLEDVLSQRVKVEEVAPIPA